MLLERSWIRGTTLPRGSKGKVQWQRMAGDVADPGSASISVTGSQLT